MSTAQTIKETFTHNVQEIAESNAVDVVEELEGSDLGLAYYFEDGSVLFIGYDGKVVVR